MQTRDSSKNVQISGIQKYVIHFCGSNIFGVISKYFPNICDIGSLIMLVGIVPIHIDTVAPMHWI